MVASRSGKSFPGMIEICAESFKAALDLAFPFRRFGQRRVGEDGHTGGGQGPGRQQSTSGEAHEHCLSWKMGQKTHHSLQPAILGLGGDPIKRPRAQPRQVTANRLAADGTSAKRPNSPRGRGG